MHVQLIVVTCLTVQKLMRGLLVLGISLAMMVVFVEHQMVLFIIILLVKFGCSEETQMGNWVFLICCQLVDLHHVVQSRGRDPRSDSPLDCSFLNALLTGCFIRFFF